MILSVINESSQITSCNVFNRNNLPQARTVYFLCWKPNLWNFNQAVRNYSKSNLLCTFKYCAFLFKQCKHNNTTNNQIKTGYGNTSFLECPIKIRENKNRHIFRRFSVHLSSGKNIALFQMNIQHNLLFGGHCLWTE